MDEIWTRLEIFLQQNAPQIYAGLAPGATEDEIAETEVRIGFPFPTDVRQFYLRHNGQADEGYCFIPGYFRLLSVSETFQEWEEEGYDFFYNDDPNSAPDPRVKCVFGDPAWIATATDIGGNAICLDFDPLPGGTVGQVISWDHEGSFRECLAPSFRAWMEIFASDLETGRMVWNAELEGYEYPEGKEAERNE